MRDEHLKDAAQDVAEDVTQEVAEDVLGAAEDGSLSVSGGRRMGRRSCWLVVVICQRRNPRSACP